MYEVSIRNGILEQTIHESSVLFSQNKLPSCNVVDGKNAISSCEFIIYPNNAGYDLLNVYATKAYTFKRS